VALGAGATDQIPVASLVQLKVPFTIEVPPGPTLAAKRRPADAS
jgi:hypothetical protein